MKGKCKTPLFFLNDDSKLLNALRKGNDQALAELFQKNHRHITSLVVRNHGKQRIILMHRVITDCPNGLEPDHCDMNKLNN